MLKLKLDEAGHVVVQDGKPVYIDDQNKEIAFDLPALQSNNARLLEESKGYKERLRVADEKLKGFEGIEDAEAARKALETVKNLGEGELVTAGKVDEIKRNAIKGAEETVAATKRQYEEKIKTTETERDKLRTQLHEEKIGNAFSRSKFVTEKIAIPVDLLQTHFGSRFTVGEDGKIVAKGADGQPIPSRAKFGEPADFEEAIEAIVEGYANKDHILKAPNHNGSGADPDATKSKQAQRPGDLTGDRGARAQQIGKMFPDLPEK